EVEHEGRTFAALEVDGDDGAATTQAEVEPTRPCDADARWRHALDPDDLRAEIGKQHGGERRGPDPLHFNDSEPGERAVLLAGAHDDCFLLSCQKRDSSSRHCGAAISIIRRTR